MEIFRKIILFRCLVLRLLRVPTELSEGSLPITWQNRRNGNRGRWDNAAETEESAHAYMKKEATLCSAIRSPGNMPLANSWDGTVTASYLVIWFLTLLFFIYVLLQSSEIYEVLFNIMVYSKCKKNFFLDTHFEVEDLIVQWEMGLFIFINKKLQYNMVYVFLISCLKRQQKKIKVFNLKY